MATVPHERSLVEKMQGKPFALLGINLDINRETLKKVEQDKQINWRSWWDGRSGKISPQWAVHGLPTIYVLDDKGVIRFKGVRGQEMDAAVDKLLKEMAQ